MTEAAEIGRAAPTRWWLLPSTLLAAVAVLHGLAPLMVQGPHWWYGIDETVYLSQLNAHVPAGGFSAPRARGATFIAAPMTLLTYSIVAVRLWVAALSVPAMYLAFHPWLRLHRGYTVPLAAGLLSSLWMVTYYGFEVMPNEWDALGLVAACGYVLRYSVDGRRRWLVIAASAMAAVALLRPSDAVYGGAALCACAVVLPVLRKRRSSAVLAVVGGVALGLIQWVVEAYTSFGGLAARISAAQAENGGGGIHFALAAQARTLAGPVLCRNDCDASAPLLYRLWWVALVVLLVTAVGTARRSQRLSVHLLPLVVGLAMLAEYTFGVTYAAPRFLIPTYALLSLPAAAGAVYLARRAATVRGRRVVRTALVAAFALHLAIQFAVIIDRVAPTSRADARRVHLDAGYLKDSGVRSDCLVLGDVGSSQNLAYALQCTNTPHAARTVVARLHAGGQVLWIRPTQPNARFGVRWRHLHLPVPTLSRSDDAFLSVHG